MIASEGNCKKEYIENGQNLCQDDERSMTDKASTSEDESKNGLCDENIKSFDQQCDIKLFEEQNQQTNNNQQNNQVEFQHKFEQPSVDLNKDIYQEKQINELKQKQSIENVNTILQGKTQQNDIEFTNKTDQFFNDKEKVVKNIQAQLSDTLKLDSQFKQDEMSYLQRLPEEQQKQVIYIENQNKYLEKSLDGAQNENQKLSAGIQTLESNYLQIEKLQKEIEQITKECRSQEEKYKNELQQKQQIESLLQQNQKIFENKCDQLQYEVNDKDKEVKKLQVQLQQLSEKLQFDQQQKYAEISELQRQLQEQQRQFIQIENQNKFLEKSLDDAQNHNQKLSANIQTLEKQQLDLNTELTQKICLIAQINEGCDNQKLKYENVLKQIQSIENENEILEEQIQQKVIEFTNKTSQLQNEVYGKEKEVKFLQAQLQQLSETLKFDQQQKQAEISELQRKLETQEKLIIDIQNQNKCLEKSLDDAQNDNQKLSADLNNSEFRNQELQAKVEKECNKIQIQKGYILKLKQESQDKESLMNQVQEDYGKKTIKILLNLYYAFPIYKSESNTIMQCAKKQKQYSKYLKKFQQICSTCKVLPDEIILNEILEIIHELQEKPASLMLSQSTQGNQMIMQILFPNLNTQLFQLYYSDDLDNFFINTDCFEFEEVDERERQILQYKKIFKDNPYKFNVLWIVVKFERTDLMKQSIMSIYKHVHKLKIPISIIVNDFHLSENSEKDKEELRTKLKLFKPNNIVFIGQFTTYEVLVEELKQALPEQNHDQIYPIELNNTLFEDEDEEEQKIMMEQLQRAINIQH